MKKSDYIGIAFPVLFALLVIFFPFNTAVTTGLFDGGELLKTQTVWTGFTTKGLDQFGNVTKYHPYIMGFLKFALLAMFGEMLKARIKNGSWKVDLFPVRVIVWGFFGLIMTVAFALFANGVQAMMGTPLWFGEPLMLSNSFGNRFIFAISTSFWMNMIFAYPMMLGHEWFNAVLAKRGFVGVGEFLSGLNAHAWGSFIPKTILYFWIPAHTVTFLLPAEFRVLMGALLSVALGFFLTIRAVKHSK